MSIVEYTGPSTPQEIRKYLMKRTKDQIVWEYLRQWREYGELEAERDEYKKAAEHYVPVAQALAAYVEELTHVAQGYRDGSKTAFALDMVLEETPATSLARLIAEKQAEALQKAADGYDPANESEDAVCAYMLDLADAYRRQAEGDD